MARPTRSSARLRGTSGPTADDPVPSTSSGVLPATGSSSTSNPANNNTNANATAGPSKAVRKKRKATASPTTAAAKAIKQAKRIPGRPPSLSPSPPPKPPLLLDRLSPLSTELIALILSHLVIPLAGAATAQDAEVPRPDLNSLANLCLVSKGLLPHARAALYRNLRVDTRVQAHAIHRTLHGNDVNKVVRSVTADVGSMSRTSSQWLGWFLFHSMHSLCGIIGSCRQLLVLTLYLPASSAAWTQSLCNSFNDLKNLQVLTKDVEPSAVGYSGAGRQEGMDVGWRPKKDMSMWAVSQFVKPLGTLKNLHTLRLCGISSDSSTLPPPLGHSLRLTEVILIEVNITNTDLLQILGDARHLKKFTLWRSSLLSKRGLTHVLKRCPSLVELRVGGSWFGAAKAEDDTNYPMDQSLPFLPHLKLLHCSGPLISPAALLLPAISLNHLLVHASPSFTPQAVHSALVKMRHDPPSVERLTLPEMKSSNSRPDRQNSGTANAGDGTGWNDTWRFTVKKTAEAKGVIIEEKWKRDLPGGAAEDDPDTSDSE
ncbi:uncharacterized protein JCM15063_001821 [Sporobolomyces koalae]|uniref:uncharacterized protein n=1 Tax=Sporobolomyces koalae TaxID=500713 RepID=UPI00316C91D4